MKSRPRLPTRAQKQRRGLDAVPVDHQCQRGPLPATDTAQRVALSLTSSMANDHFPAAGLSRNMRMILELGPRS